MGIPTLIKTQTASDSASLVFVDGTSDVVFDGTYDEYMFVFTDINPETDDTGFGFQVSVNGGTDYGVSKTTTFFRAYHDPDDGSSALAYVPSWDTQGTTAHLFNVGVGSGSDESLAGILNFYNPASTTFVKHYMAQTHNHYAGNSAVNILSSGYINTTSAVNAIKFFMVSDNFDGVIQMYGIA